MAVYIVKKGDSLSAIAKKLGLPSWQSLYESNKSTIGSNPNLIRVGQQLTYGDTQPQTVETPQTQGTGAADIATEIGQNMPTNFGEVLPWEQYFDPELAKGSAEQVYAQYFAPIVQEARTGLESEFAGRGLTRSGIRGQGVSDMYRKYGQEQQAGIESDIMQQRQMAQEDYGRLQQLYEQSSGKQKPAEGTKYTPYKVARPVTSAGTYGSSYLDWLNRATRV